jgi:alpha-L-glutamate ligase-like protein
MMNWRSDILTKNARNRFYLPLNGGRERAIANSKTWTKKVLSKADVPVPQLIAVLKNPDEVNRFAWDRIDGGFVVKPARSSGGEGIWIIKKRAKWAGEWFLNDGQKITISDLRLHCFDILEGRFSLEEISDKVLVEERIKIHPKFLRFTRIGTPDVRIIVYNKIPVMAMLRIPTEKSKGKANLHQGAIGLGLDMATGITTFGVYHDNLISRIYDLRRKRLVKVNGIRVPEWRRLLEVAVSCAQAIPGLRFFGVDLVLDVRRGPLVLELNARPGLSIQICNRAGLRRRLLRVEGIRVRNTEHAIKIAQDLFGESFVDRVKMEEGIAIVEVLEPIKIKGINGKRHEILAKIDTGALRSSIDKGLARQLGLLRPDNILFLRHYRSALGKQRQRPVVEAVFWLKGRKIKSAVSVTDRSHLNTPVLIGRRDLGGFLIRPEPVSTRIRA